LCSRYCFQGVYVRNKLVFLGTAGDSLTLAKQSRRSGGFALKLEGGQYHVDPGPGALASAVAAGINPRETICVLASNNSLLASDGVNSVVDAMTLGGVDRFGVIIAAESVANGTENEGPVLRESTKQSVERVVTFADTTRIGINYLNIYPRKARHPDATALGFRLETPSVTIGYTGDTDYFSGLENEHEDVDDLVVRCRHPKGTQEAGSLNVEEVIKFLEAAKPKLAILTGFGGKLLDSDVVSTARSIHRESKVQVVVAKDGLEVDLDQFKK